MKKLLLILIVTMQTAFATQIREVYEAAELSFHISNRDLNRIKVVGDRISSLKYSDEDLIISGIDTLGEAYVRPSRDGLKSIAGFVITEKGHTYKLILVPRSISSTQIILKNTEGNHSIIDNNTTIGVDTTEKNEMLELVKLMNSGSMQKDEKYTIKSTSGSWFKASEIEAKKVMIYQGEVFTGLLLKVKNKTDMELKISEKTFYKDGVRAVSLETNIIPPKSEVNLYVVLK